MSTFHQFAQSHGVITDRLHPRDSIQRLPTVNKPHRTNAAVFWDGMKGWIWIWGEQEQTIWFDDPNARPWTPAEKAEWGRKQQAMKAKKLAEQKEAAEAAEELIQGAGLDVHPYLASKGFPEVKGFIAGNGALLIPMRDVQSNRITGLQYVMMQDNRWVKMFLPQQRSTGSVFSIGPANAPETVLCEGYATGLSIAAAIERMRLRMCVACCFSAYNIEAVAPLIDGRRFVFADHDFPDKLGRRAGQDRAEATGLPWVMSDTEGQDANDLHQTAGILAVCKKLMELRTK